MERLPKAFLARMESQLGDGYAAYLGAMEASPRRALRVNTLKIAEESFCGLVDFSIERIRLSRELEKSDISLEDYTNNDIEKKQILEKSSQYSPITHTKEINRRNEIEESSEYEEDNANNSNHIATKIEISDIIEGDISNNEPICYAFPDEIAIGRHPLHAAGLCYVQEPSAQIPAWLLGARPGMTVLDLCAAPGGKAGQLAAAMGNTGLLVANEPVPARAEALLGNLERLGVKNAVVTAMYPDALCAALSGLCDAVLVDAPCSGEGMFRRDAGAIADWSTEHVRACAARQRGILDAADRALRPGGALVYSTCTFSREENEETVAAFLDAHPSYRQLFACRLYPHRFPGEGQFLAKLVKGDDAETDARASRGKSARVRPPEAATAWEAFRADTLAECPGERLLSLPDGRVLLPPVGYDRLPAGLRVLRAGLLLGEARQGRFLPAHALAMALPGEAFLRRVPLAGDALTAYLAGEIVGCDPALAGYCAVTYAGYPLGLGKAVKGTLKNHLPKGLRIH